MASDNRIYWIWLAELLGQGSKLASKLINIYGNAKDVFETSADALLDRDGYTDAERTQIRKSFGNNSLERAEHILAECRRLQISVATPETPDYPGCLGSLSNMPLVLYYKGKIPDMKNRLFISVVGTRKMSDYGRRIAYALGYGLALGGAVVVSGMALGTDSMAMAGAMDAGAPTIAVLGSGVDVIYPREHREMYYKTIANGAVISEYPPGSSPSGHHFPIRNRIISGISEGTVVVEGSADSGSLITARHAAEQGRKVFAVPGKIGETGSEGPLSLLCDTALPATTAEDILMESKFMYPHTVRPEFVHAKLRNMDFETASLTAMERSRIAVRGEGQYYGTGVYGGRTRDYRKENTGTAPVNTPSEQAPRILQTDRKAQAAPEYKLEPVPSEKGKIPVISSIIGKLSQKDAEKTEKKISKSEENNNITTGFTLNMLDESDIKVYNIMQPNVPVVPDNLVRDDLDIGDIMSALSSLEMAGLVESSVGGYFTRIGDTSPITLTAEDNQPT